MPEQSHKNKDYDDIIDLPHHISARHPQMPMDERAAQFSPFAALTGYKDIIQETSRYTSEEIELSESSKEVLDRQLQIALNQPKPRSHITLTYFVPDERKSGGSYQTIHGVIHSLDSYHRILLLEDGRKIPIASITAISGLPSDWDLDISG